MFSAQETQIPGPSMPPIGPAAMRIINDMDSLLGHDAAGARKALLDLQALLEDLPFRVGQSEAVATEAEGELSGGMAPWRVKRVRELVQNRLSQSLSIGEMARAAGLSASHFCRAFKAATGETPHGHVMRMRLEKAMALMMETDDSLGRIAAACGLADQAHLSRIFRRHMDTTPYRWRRARRLV